MVVLNLEVVVVVEVEMGLVCFVQWVVIGDYFCYLLKMGGEVWYFWCQVDQYIVVVVGVVVVFYYYWCFCYWCVCCQIVGQKVGGWLCLESGIYFVGVGVVLVVYINVLGLLLSFFCDVVGEGGLYVFVGLFSDVEQYFC